MRTAASASLLVAALAAACSSDPSPTPSPVDASPVDTGADAASDAPVDRPATPDGSTSDGGAAACGNAFGTRCNLVTGGGCDTGQACYLLGGVTGMTAQCRAAGSGGWDDRCTTTTDCREGFLCVEPGRCAKLCCDDDSACNDESRGGRAGGRCQTTLNNGRGLKLCVADSGCNLFTTGSNGCPADSPRCMPSGDASQCDTFGAMCTPGGDGARCCTSDCCGVGFLCVGTQTGGTCDPATSANACRRMCNLRVSMPDAQCGTGQRCRSFSAMSALPTWLGYCAP